MYYSHFAPDAMNEVMMMNKTHVQFWNGAVGLVPRSAVIGDLVQLFVTMKKKAKAEKLTPYQGNRRCFGAFQCELCDRQWYSGNSWANYGQQCEACLVNVYPHAQWPLKKQKNQKDHKAHPVDLCGKCEALGRSCRTKLDKKS